MEGAGNVDLSVHKDLSMSSTRKAAVSVALQVTLTLRKFFTATRRVLTRRCLRDSSFVEQTQIDKRQVVADEYSQEEFSDESINLNSVLTWNVDSSGRLRVDLQHEFSFDSACSSVGQERIQTAIRKLRDGTLRKALRR